MKIPLRAILFLLFSTLSLACGGGGSGGDDDSSVPSDFSESASGGGILSVQRGWFVSQERFVWGLGMHNAWCCSDPRPNITANAEGDVRPNRQEDLARLTDNMLLYAYPALEHNFGLWYDRRRDVHDESCRRNDQVVGPFMEQPWARSGVGMACDGLSRYDLTEFNQFYFNRLREFAQESDQKGTILFYNFYFQHTLLELDAHYVDFPWRPGNAIQDTGLPNGIPAANAFYDLNNPVRRELHRLYIRHVLDQLSSYSHVVYLLSVEYTGPLDFMQFWIDTVREWEAETGNNVLMALGATKDVTDAILADPVRSPAIDVIDLRYWWYEDGGALIAPPGGQEVAGRYAYVRGKGPYSAEQVYRQAREYRTRYPQKALLNMFRPTTDMMWAFLFGGGSFVFHQLDYPNGQSPLDYIAPELSFTALPAYTFINTALVDRLYLAEPRSGLTDNDQRNWVLAASGDFYLVYLRDGGTVSLNLSETNESFTALWVDPENGQILEDSRSGVDGGGIASFTAPDSRPWILYLD